MEKNRKFINQNEEEYLSLIFVGFSGLLLMFSCFLLSNEENTALYLLGVLLVFFWISQLLGFIIFIVFNKWKRFNAIQILFWFLFFMYNRKWKIKKKSPAKSLVISVFCFMIFSIFLQNQVQAHREFFEPNEGLDANIGNPLTQGWLFVEIDYSYDLKNKFPFLHLIWYGYETFKKMGTFAFFMIDDPIPEKDIKINSSNMVDYAELMNRTRDFSFAVHCLILHNGSIEGLKTFFGYAPHNKYWSSAMSNYTEPKFCGCLVFYDTIIQSTLNPLNLIKVVIHEVGHYLGADHSKWGIMKVSSINFIEFFFSWDSQLQMNIYDKWSVEKGFEVYS